MYAFNKEVYPTKLTREIQASAIKVAVDFIKTFPGMTQVWFKSALDQDDQAILNQLVADHVPTPDQDAPVIRSKDDLPIFESTPIRRGRKGSDSFTIVTHDFTDRTTWYQNSVRELGVTLTNIGNNSYQAPQNHRHWINIHGVKLTLDRKKILKKDGSLGDFPEFEIVVYDNGIVVDPRHYSVDFPNGMVVFDSVRSGPITADISHNDGVSYPGDFIVRPTEGYAYYIDHVEIQFSKQITFNGDAILLEGWGGDPSYTMYDDFRDELFQLGFGQTRTIYRSTRDLINWCNNQYPILPVGGTPEFDHDIFVFPFRYLLAEELSSQVGALLRISLTNHIGFNGEISTVTFYMERRELT